MNNDYFSKIRPVEAPPYLFTRIQQKIKKNKEDVMPGKISWAIGIAFVLIMVLNIGSIVRNGNSKNNRQNYAQAIQLLTDNELYQ
jgi:hypothetical protein